MKLDTLPVTQSEARDQLREYRNAVKLAEERRPLDANEMRQLREDRATLRLLNQIARGVKLLNIHDTMQAAGCKPDGSPVLAIARANWTHCWCTDSGEGVKFRGTSNFTDAQLWCVGIPKTALPSFRRPKERWNWKAVVPQVPPRHRPAGNPMHYHILWEAEWGAVPVDPALLKHMVGPFYAVLAVWDLTAVERTVLGLRQP